MQYSPYHKKSQNQKSINFIKNSRSKGSNYKVHLGSDLSGCLFDNIKMLQ